MQAPHNASYCRGQLSEHLPKTPEDQMSVSYWMGKLGHYLQQFEAAPTQAKLMAFIVAMADYRQAVSEGLALARIFPSENSRANTLAEWHKLQLAEGLAMFRTNPTETRLINMQRQLTDYMDLVAQGRIKP